MFEIKGGIIMNYYLANVIVNIVIFIICYFFIQGVYILLKNYITKPKKLRPKYNIYAYISFAVSLVVYFSGTISLICLAYFER